MGAENQLESRGGAFWFFALHGSIKPPRADISSAASICLTSAIRTGQMLFDHHSTADQHRTYAQDMTNENGVEGGLGNTSKRRRFLTRQEAVDLITNHQADPGLLDDLEAWLASLPPLTARQRNVLAKVRVEIDAGFTDGVDGAPDDR